jgi:Amino acid synthesis
MQPREIHLLVQEIHIHAGRPVRPAARRVAAVAVIENPRAGKRGGKNLDAFIELSVAAGELLSARALGALGQRPTAYGKAVLVGTGGDLEQGAAMIHCRMGLSMRRAIRDGLALIPGNAKLGAPGGGIDVVLGGINDAWDYDAMDSMEIRIPGAPRWDELLLVVAFATGRPNARITGATPQTVQTLVEELHRPSKRASPKPS